MSNILNEVRIDNIQQQDNDILRTYLKNNEDLFIAIRSLFFGQEISKQHKEMIVNIFKDDKLMGAFKRNISPEIKDEAGLSRLLDKWSQLIDVEQILGSNPEKIRQIVSSAVMLSDMCDKALDSLRNPDNIQISLDFDTEKALDTDPYGVKIIARNMYVKHINGKLNNLRVIADTTQKDLEDYIANFKKNSNK